VQTKILLEIAIKGVLSFTLKGIKTFQIKGVTVKLLPPTQHIALIFVNTGTDMQVRI